MAGYLIANYRATNPAGYEDYAPAVMPTLKGVVVLVADYESEPIEDEPFNVTVVSKIHLKDADRTRYNSPEYQKIMHLRTDNTEGFSVFADEFVTP